MKKIKYYHLYAVLNTPILIGIRFLCYAILTYFLFQFSTVGGQLAEKLIGLYLFFVLNEWFIVLGINRKMPEYTIDQENISLIETVLFPVRVQLEAHTLEEFIRISMKQREVEVLLRKISTSYDTVDKPISRDQILAEASQLVKASHGRYISYLDVFVAYLLLTEDTSQFLEKHGITRQDIEGLHFWIRSKEEVDIKHPLKLLFTGSGVFDFFIYGWSTELAEYAEDITYKTLHEKHIPVFVGRTAEYNQFIEALSNPSSNNALIIGEVGTGRETLVSYFAYESFMGYLGALSHKKVYQVLIERLIAGITSPGELQMRLEEILAEIEHSGNVAIVIKNIENIFGGGGYNLNLSGVLSDYLNNAHVPLIGITTPEAYKLYFENQEEMKSLFEVVKIDEPDDYTAHFMVMEKSFEIEREHNVTITYEAVKEIISLSSSYLPDEFLPGRAIRLLEDTVTSVILNKESNISAKEVQQFVEQKTKIVLTDPTKEEKEKLLHLEDEIHKRMIDQEEAVTAIAVALRRLRSGFTNKRRPISTFLFLGPTGVGKTELAKALAAIYFGSETNMIRLDMSEYQTQDSLKRILGGFSEEERSMRTVVDQVREQPFSLVLLDEFEKAHPQILDLFLQLLDEGRLTDNRGRSVSFTNTIVIATSNAGSEFIRENIEREQPFDEIRHELINHLLSNNVFRPELLNRFDEVVMFKTLSPEDARAIVKLQLSASLKRLEEKGIFLSSTDSVIGKIVSEGYDKEFGGRNLRRYIDSHVEEFISKEILEDRLKKGTHGVLSLSESGGFIIQ